MKDIIIPIVFPDYKITLPYDISTSFKVPDLMPFFDIMPDTVSIDNKVGDLGHAGILFINGITGVTKYFEYGRYDELQKGKVRKLASIPDLRINNGNFDKNSLKVVLSNISSRSGKNGRISGAYIEVDNKFQIILDYAKRREIENLNVDRESYNIIANSCVHFMRDALMSVDLKMPVMIDPRPNSYIEEIQDVYSRLEFNPENGTLFIEGF